MEINTLQYIDFERVNSLLEGFNQTTGFVTAFVDFKGNVLSQSVWKNVCKDFHRENPNTLKRCNISDTILSKKMKEGERYHSYTCLNGLVDVAVPIIIKGFHIANLFTGQFFYEEPDMEFFKAQAKEFGFDESAYLAAVREVPVVSEEKAKKAVEFLLNMTQLISEMTQQKTELLELNRALQHNEEKYRVLFNTFPLGITITDSSGTVIEHNQRASEILNLQNNTESFPAKLVERMSFVHPDGSPMEHTELASSQALQERRLVENIEIGIKHDDSNITWLNVTAAPLFLEDVRVVTTFSDITEQKRTQKALHQSFERFRIAQDLSPDGFTILHPVRNNANEIIDFTWVYENPAIGRINGTNVNVITGQKLLDRFPSHRTNNLFEIYKQVAETGHSHTLEMGINGRSDKQETWLRLVVVPMAEDIAILAQDLTERKKAEAMLEYQQDHDFLTGLYNRNFLEKEFVRMDDPCWLPVSLIIADTNGLKLVNDSFGHLVGDEILQKTATLIQSHCKENDIVARFGGDEFVMLLPNTTQEEAKIRLKQIESAVKAVKIKSLQLTLSFGYETRNSLDDDFQTVFKKAEDMMYRNKLYESSSVKNKTIRIVINSLFAKSSRESEHSKRVSELCCFIADKLGMPTVETQRMRIAGLMHDIGKIGINEAILNKEEPLDEEEWKSMKRHPEIGFRILSASNEFADISNAILEHHERWDGKGYPRGLTKDSISLQARIIAVADAYDAMTSERSYKKPISHEEAIADLTAQAGTQFDPYVAQVFIEHCTEFLGTH